MKEKKICLELTNKVENILKVAWIWSHHLPWKFKLWAWKFTWGVKAKHCWALSTNFWKQKNCWHHPTMFCLITANNFYFHWRWRWWDEIQAIFLNLFYFICWQFSNFIWLHGFSLYLFSCRNECGSRNYPLFWLCIWNVSNTWNSTIVI